MCLTEVSLRNFVVSVCKETCVTAVVMGCNKMLHNEEESGWEGGRRRG